MILFRMFLEPICVVPWTSVQLSKCGIIVDCMSDLGKTLELVAARLLRAVRDSIRTSLYRVEPRDSLKYSRGTSAGRTCSFTEQVLALVVPPVLLGSNTAPDGFGRSAWRSTNGSSAVCGKSRQVRLPDHVDVENASRQLCA